MGHDYVFSSGSKSRDNQNLMQLQLFNKYEGQSISNETFSITQVCNDW